MMPQRSPGTIFSEAQAKVVELDDRLAEPLGARPPDLEHPLAPAGDVVGHFVNELGRAIEPGLLLGRPRLGAHLRPRDLLGEQPGAAGGRLALHIEADEAAGEEALVGRIVPEEVAPVELEKARRDVVHEIPIVGDEEHRARPLQQLALEPADGARVEVVGGLVEEQHVGRAEQKPREIHPAPLPPRERADLLLAGLHPEPAEHVLHPVLEGEAATGLNGLGDLGEPGGGACVLGLLAEPLVLGEELLEMGEPRAGDVGDAGLGVELGHLGEQPDLGTVVPLHLAVVRGLQAGERAQQRRLAGAVFAHQGHALLGEHGQLDAVKERLAAGVGIGEAARREHAAFLYPPVAAGEAADR